MVKIKKQGQSTKERNVQGFEVIMNKASDLVTEYQKQLIIAVSAVVIIAIVIGGYSLVRSQAENKAAPLFATAYTYYTPTGKLGADYTKALELFRNVHEKYSHTKSGATAQYYAGNCLVNLGRYDEALKEYEAFIRSYSGEKILSAMVYQRMGYVYNALGKTEESIAAFKQAESLGGAGIATIELAHLYEKTGNIMEAQKQYRLAMDQLAGTPLGVEAMGKIQKIAPVQQTTTEEAKDGAQKSEVEQKKQ